MNYSELLNNVTRANDYSEANKLCKAFGKRFRDWMENATSVKYLEALEYKYGCGKERLVMVAKGKPTLIHPLVTLELAGWLSPEFQVHVNETYKRYIEGDVALATEIVNRSTNLEEVKKHEDAVTIHRQYLEAYHGVHDQLKEHKCDGRHHGAYNKHVNQLAGVVQGQRGEMSREQRLLMMAAQAMSEVALIRDQESLGWTAVKVAKAAANLVGELPEAKKEQIPIFEFH